MQLPFSVIFLLLSPAFVFCFRSSLRHHSRLTAARLSDANPIFRSPVSSSAVSFSSSMSTSPGARTRPAAVASEDKEAPSKDKDNVNAAELKAQAESIFRDDSRPVVLFDGVCNLCNGAVNFLLKYDSTGKFRMAALQSQAGKALLHRSGREANDISSIVLVTKESEEASFKSDAALRIGRELDWFLFRVLAGAGLCFPRFIRDTAYDWVARNRYALLGKRDTCRYGEKGFEGRFVKDPQ
uniref:Thiol-disulfide oxidoreductase DCC n=1 Tax=Chromera velia CCMP2878 TaxID=1169474 RepID=A0A0G4HJ00_9ALVE|mmetsp:Transcript_11972/g.22998  ORF Transcript_11972/g.22998 Transcript_11972/m.22998 type:complete len:240 (+) Transcript_11972:160-879(+)|eukprot:Cvel_7015.t1-p1 / transcript=Cvel_7015.t1 / gene=Cvel_7015 / organism=Chromera_velia_CCMP2878 / gene_product=DCC family protein At1g52590, chloroplastic, putative / transcript_product=DCC family protein At1g52590, chloroplastic, putative / location=Cvel_scaffold357:62653-65378(+) / protein_length=239 / sequence_SO=supercontig / SO=protein_coding / is_pseudo=false